MEGSFYTRLNKKEKYIINSCFFAIAISGLYGIIGGSLLPIISEQYNLNNTLSGALLSALEFGGMLAGFVAGLITLCLGDKRSVLIFSVSALLGLLLLIVTGKPILLLLAFLFLGLGKGGLSNFSNAMVNDVSRSSSSALNILHGMFTLGAIIAPFLVIITSNLGGDKGWKLALGTIMVLLLVSIYFFSNIEPSRRENLKQGEVKKVSYAFLKNKYFWITIGILFFYLCTEKTINGWIVKYFVDANIMSRQYAQMLASLLWIFILFGRIACAFIGDRIEKTKLLLAISIGTGVSYFLLLATTAPVIITIAIMGLGFFMGGIYPTAISNIGSIITQYPMAMGAILVIGGLGATGMPMVTGALADLYGVFIGMAAILLAIIFMIGFAVWNLKVK